MTPGTQVWAAREGKDGVEVDAARVLRVRAEVLAVVDPPLLGGTEWPVRALHATRTAALEALAERLEESAVESAHLAEQFTVRASEAQRQAEQAKRMAGEGR